jgi:hypothetical protein
MEIKEFVGGIEAESTASAALKASLASTLLDLLTDFAFGVGLTLRLAASVAAMRLGLFAPIFAISVAAAPAAAGDSCCAAYPPPTPRCAATGDDDDAAEAPEPDPGPSCWSRAATKPDDGYASESTSGKLPPVTCGARG